jgi:hypothetical protein
MNILSWGLVLVVLVVALRYWRIQGSSVGIWFLLGGALTTLNEPIVDVLGKCWFPAIDSWVLIKAWGVSIPAHMLPVYIWFVGGQAFLSYQFYSKGITQKRVFRLYAIYALVNIALEIPGLNTASPMYSYYGNQPLVIANFPLWWTFCNALMPMAMGAIVFRLDPILQGMRQTLIIPLAWMTAAATNGLIAAPVWLALNMEGSSLVLTHAAALLSLGMGLMVCYGVCLLVAVDASEAVKRPTLFGKGAHA